MSTNYNNYTFNIFKMNTNILTIISTNKRGKNFNFHSNTSRAYLYAEKKFEKSETLSLPHHTATQLQQPAVLQNRKNLPYRLTQVTLSLSHSLCLR